MLWMQYINPVLVVLLVVLVLLEILNVTECFCPGFTVSRLWCVQVTRVVKRTYQVRSQECSQRGSILDKHLHPIHNRCSAALFCLHAAVRTLLDAGLPASALRYMNATLHCYAASTATWHAIPSNTVAASVLRGAAEATARHEASVYVCYCMPCFCELVTVNAARARLRCRPAVYRLLSMLHTGSAASSVLLLLAR
jgi:hypothetical protein